MRIAIIGAGPAGLAALATLSKSSTAHVILFDSGKSHEERNHETAADLGIGSGGAGLFSDGKFSFYPSGTYIYRLKNQDIIDAGYKWMCEELQKVGIESFPLIRNQHDVSQDFFIKDYPSSYGDLQQRKELIASLVSAENCTYFYNTNVKKISKFGEKYHINFTKHQIENGSIDVDYVILATGRLGNLTIPYLLPDFQIQKANLRYEVGIRIETPASIGFLSRKKTPDVKVIWKELFGEIRTFCTCRNGEVWNIPYANLSAISGRSDGPKTQYSNFGLLLRFTGDHFNVGEKYFNNILQSDLIKNGNVAWQTLPDFINSHPASSSEDIKQNRPWFPKEKFQQQAIVKFIGEDMHAKFRMALEKLLDWSPDLLSNESMVLFPAIEGTGIYPALTNDLQIEGENIWCCGDLAGKFRGIIPAFLSGYYAAQCVLNSKEKSVNHYILENSLIA